MHPKKCVSLLVILCILITQMSYAQNRKSTLRGIVSSAFDPYLPDVTIRLNNSQGQAMATTISDSLGMFFFDGLNVDSIYSIDFRRVGYQNEHVENIIIRANGNSILGKLQKVDTTNLQEVVVVGYGSTQKRSTIVGAVETVNPKDLTVTSGSFTSSFAGRIAGMVSVQKSGQPGADAANFWIRGMATFGSNASPLIVLDGVEIVSEMLNNLAPESIKSISVLKDATATALYGSRGANGVLVVTTREGTNNGRMNVNLRLQGGSSQPTRMTPIANGVDYMNSYNEARSNEGKDPYYSADKITGTEQKLNPYAYPSNDWYHLLFKDRTYNENANINVSGGGEKVTYFLNAAGYNENGIMKEQPTGSFNTNVSSKKYMFQSNVLANLTSTTKVGVKLNAQIQYMHLPNTSPNTLFGYTQKINPTDFPAYYPSSLVPDAQPGITYYGNAPNWDGGLTQVNPLAELDRGYQDQYLSYMTSVFNFDQDLPFITKGLKFKLLASFYNKTWSSQTRYNQPYFKTLNSYTKDADGNYDLDLIDIGNPGSTYFTYGVSRSGSREFNLQGSLQYDKTIKGYHNISVFLIYHQKQTDDNGVSATETGILTHREQGTAGRLSYNYDSRYLAEFDFGYTGSENFVQGKRFGFFPSYAMGWNVSNEAFWSPLKDKIHLLKIRGSYGKVGNDALPLRFPYLTTIATNAKIYNIYLGPNAVIPTGITLTGIGNPNATWEQSTKKDIGLEVGLFHSLNLIVDWFQEKRTGIFMQKQSIPNYAGYAGVLPYANIGAVNNRGIDASLEYSKSFTKDLFVAFRGTFTYAHNTIVNQDVAPLTPDYMSPVGHPINTIFGLVSEGLFQDQSDVTASNTQTFTPIVNPGDIKYRDLNNDGKIDANDKTAIGDPTVPEIVYGFGPSIKFKKWDFSFFFQGNAKVSIQMSGMHPFTDGQYTGYNIAQWIVDDHWSESNPNAAYPRLSTTINQNNVQTSSFWVKNGSFLRLKTMEVGYTYKNMRWFMSGTNLFVLSGFKYWDPELGSGNGLTYPLQKTFNIGMQFNFNN